jgi:hypothetical protein
VRFRAWPWAAAVAIGTAAVLTSYLVVIFRQGTHPVAWVVGVLAYAGVLPTIGLATPWTRKPSFVISAVLLTVLTMLAMLSIGVLILPVAITAWVASAIVPSRSADRSGYPVPPGWYRDPDDPYRQRYWDGRTWTRHVA